MWLGLLQSVKGLNSTIKIDYLLEKKEFPLPDHLWSRNCFSYLWTQSEILALLESQSCQPRVRPKPLVLLGLHLASSLHILGRVSFHSFVVQLLTVCLFSCGYAVYQFCFQILTNTAFSGISNVFKGESLLCVESILLFIWCITLLLTSGVRRPWIRLNPPSDLTILFPPP